VTHPPLPLVRATWLADIEAKTPIWLLVRLHASTLATSVRLPCNKLYCNMHFLPFATMLVCSSVSYDQAVKYAVGSQSYSFVGVMFSMSYWAATSWLSHLLVILLASTLGRS